VFCEINSEAFFSSENEEKKIHELFSNVKKNIFFFSIKATN